MSGSFNKIYDRIKKKIFKPVMIWDCNGRGFPGDGRVCNFKTGKKLPGSGIFFKSEPPRRNKDKKPSDLPVNA
jgi:hypothetical protein